MLFSYLQRARLLLKDMTFAQYNDFDLISYVNTARGQIAGEAECVRVYGSLAVTAPTQQYPFSAITFPAGTVGVAGPINVRMITYAIPGTSPAGNVLITPREWEFFNTFVLSQAAPTPGAPNVWAQFGQGASGTIFLNLPDQAYTLSCDTVCYPDPLALDSDSEALPYLWTDAVPYFTAYLALLTAQQADAAKNMLDLYRLFAARARQFANPSVLGHQYEQAPDPQMASRLGITKAA